MYLQVSFQVVSGFNHHDWPFDLLTILSLILDLSFNWASQDLHPFKSWSKGCSGPWYTVPTAKDCVLYYLCGYLVHSLLKHERCAACIIDIKSPNAVSRSTSHTRERVKARKPTVSVPRAVQHVSRYPNARFDLCWRKISFWSFTMPSRTVTCQVFTVLSTKTFWLQNCCNLTFCCRCSSQQGTPAKASVPENVASVRKKAELMWYEFCSLTVTTLFCFFYTISHHHLK